MVLALNVSVYFCKLLPLHMNGNLPVGIGMHVFAMICDLMHLQVSQQRTVGGAFYIAEVLLSMMNVVSSPILRPLLSHWQVCTRRMDSDAAGRARPSAVEICD
eukprot:UN4700